MHREQGLIVAPGNPLGAARRRRPGAPRSALRQSSARRRDARAAGLRAGREGIDRTAITGYAREEPTHLAVAAAIAAGTRRLRNGRQAAARAFDLDFVPVTQEPYDLVLDEGMLASDLLAPLWRLLESADFRASVEQLGGYDTAEMGRRIR